MVGLKVIVFSLKMEQDLLDLIPDLDKVSTVLLENSAGADLKIETLMKSLDL